MKPKQERGSRVEVLRAPRLRRYRWLVHGFSTRRPGEFNLSYSTGPRATVARHRRLLLSGVASTQQVGRWQLVTLRQRHTDLIQVIHKSCDGHRRVLTSGRGRVRERDGAVRLVGDALITDQPGLLVGVQVADCLPLLLVDPRQRVVAAVHAGWRGSVQHIAEKTVGRMRQEFGCRPQSLLAAIGPGIHRCCYAVGRPVVEAFEGQFPYREKLVRRVQPSPTEVHWQPPLFSPEPSSPPADERRARAALTAPATAEKLFLDLVEANRRQLRAAGLKASYIWASPLCTACRTDLFFSHRAEGSHTGRMMGVVGLVD